MKKQQIYLPNLNTLFTQHLQRTSHLNKIRSTHSSCEHSQDMMLLSRQKKEKQRQVVKLIKEESNQTSPVRKLRESVVLKHQSSLGTYREEREKRSPFERKKGKERQQQNARMYHALQNSIPVVVSRGSRQDHQALDIIKERISKYSKEGNMVQYKFKKSLAEIVRRKRSQKDGKVQHVDRIEEVRRQLEELNQKRYLTQTGVWETQTPDIFLHSSVHWRQGSNSHKKEKETINASNYGSRKDGDIKDQSSLDSSVFIEKKRRVSNPLKCKTQPSSSSFLANPRQYSNKRKAVQQSLTAQIKNLSPSSKGQNQVPNVQKVLTQMKARKGHMDMQIVCLPQLPKDIVCVSSRKE